MIDKQPEALRLADLIDNQGPALRVEVSAELRRLHEVNAELLRVLRQALVALESCGEDYVYDGEDEHRVDCYDYKLVDEAIAAIRKVQGEKNEDHE